MSETGLCSCGRPANDQCAQCQRIRDRNVGQDHAAAERKRGAAEEMHEALESLLSLCEEQLDEARCPEMTRARNALVAADGIARRRPSK